jgi:uncharacterized protein YjiS (DUF1127 family)
MASEYIKLGVPSWSEIVSMAGRRVSSDMVTIVVVIGNWTERARQRRCLAALDERMLKDCGLSRADARQEASRPFWQA